MKIKSHIKEAICPACYMLFPEHLGWGYKRQYCSVDCAEKHPKDRGNEYETFRIAEIANQWSEPVYTANIHELPEASGVYAISLLIDRQEKLLYIGQAINLRKRIQSREILRVEKLGAGWQTIVQYILVPQEALNNLEIYFIKKLNPLFNAVHNDT